MRGWILLSSEIIHHINIHTISHTQSHTHVRDANKYSQRPIYKYRDFSKTELQREEFANLIIKMIAEVLTPNGFKNRTQVYYKIFTSDI